jgi:putative phosphoesterase
VKVGLVSDTHDLLDPKLDGLFRGVETILHAGDVTKPHVIEGLARTAPVHVARGNNDVGPFGASLSEHVWLEVGALTVLVVHQLGSRAKLDPTVTRALARRPAELVLHGHSHRPGIQLAGDRLFVNPGSAGPRRFSLPRTAGILTVRGREVAVELFDLAPAEPAPFGAPFRARL